VFQGLSTAARRGPADSIVRALLMVALRFRDVWETMACQRLCDSLTFHVFTTPPTKVYAGFIMVFSKLFIFFVAGSTLAAVNFYFLCRLTVYGWLINCIRNWNMDT
jgi:hypothetical protein